MKRWARHPKKGDQLQLGGGFAPIISVYQKCLYSRIEVAPKVGFEPTTHALTVRRSTPELLGNI